MYKRIVLAMIFVAVFMVSTMGSALASHHSKLYWDRLWGHKQHMKDLERIQDHQEWLARQLDAGPATSLAACIIRTESGGATWASNGPYPSGHHGIAQWNLEAWVSDGGMKYASDPLYATYRQQVTILNRALARNEGWRWRPFDGC